MADFGQREDLYSVVIIIAGSDGQKVKFTFDSLDGGSVTAKETKYRAANGTEDQQSLGGASEVANVSVKALMTFAMYQWVPWMLNQTGKADMWVNKQPLDTDGNPFGKALAYKGKLQEVMPPPTNSESDTAAMLGLTQSSTTVSSA